MVTLAKPKTPIAKPGAAKPAAKLATPAKPATAKKPALAKPAASKEPTISYKTGDVVEFVKYEKDSEDPLFSPGDRLVLVAKEKDKDSGLTYFVAVKEEDHEQYTKSPDDVTGDQLFPSEFKKAEKREIDVYEISIVKDEKLEEILGNYDDALAAAKGLQEDAARNIFYMGGVLQYLFANREYLKYGDYKDDIKDDVVVKGSGWDKFTQENFNEGGRKCSALISTYRAFAAISAEKKLDLDEIATDKKIGWVKLSAMAPHVKADNVEALLESARSKNVADFKDEVKTDYVASGAEARSGGTAAKVKRTTLKIVLFEDQFTGVDYVLKAVMKEIGTEDYGPALERIVMDWAAQNLSEPNFKKARKQMRDKVKELEKSGVDVKDRKQAASDLDDYLARNETGEVEAEPVA